jgi:chromosomal replication initiation ATPase DnaA
LVAARHELWWRVRTELNYSFPKIARLAHRDHSSVIYAVQVFSAKMLDSKQAQVQSEQTM